MSSVPEDKYLFKLVAFPDNEIDPVSIDIVPGKWIFWDHEAGELLCSYMPGELTEKKKKDLQKMVQQCKPADPKWPKYKVIMKGRAQTYEDAEIGMHQLGNKKYAYSTDDEIKCLERARQEKKFYQRKKVTSDTITVEEQLESARVDLSESVEEPDSEDSAGATKSPRKVSSADTSSNTSPEEERPRQKKISKTKQKNFSRLIDSSPEQTKAHPREPPRMEQRRRHEEHRGFFPDATLISNKLPKVPMGRNDTECSKNYNHNSRGSSGLNANGRSSDPVLQRFVSRSSDNGSQTNEGPGKNKESARKTDSQSSKPKEKDRCDTLTRDKRSAQPSPRSISNKKSSRPSRLDSDAMGLSNNLQDVGLSTVREGVDENGSLRELIEQRYTDMKKLISDLKGLVLSNGVSIKNLREELIDNPPRGIVGIEEEEDPDGIQLPCTTLETFDLFEQKLKSDAVYRNKMNRKISKSTDRDQEMTRCLGTGVRMFMTQSVGIHFVPLKATKDKRVFRDTALCKILQGIFVRVFGTQENPVSTQKFDKSLKGIFHNTKDWSGQAKRVRARDKKNNPPLVENFRNEEEN